MDSAKLVVKAALVAALKALMVWNYCDLSVNVLGVENVCRAFLRKDTAAHEL